MKLPRVSKKSALPLLVLAGVIGLGLMARKTIKQHYSHWKYKSENPDLPTNPDAKK